MAKEPQNIRGKETPMWVERKCPVSVISLKQYSCSPLSWGSAGLGIHTGKKQSFPRNPRPHPSPLPIPLIIRGARGAGILLNKCMCAAGQGVFPFSGGRQWPAKPGTQRTLSWGNWEESWRVGSRIVRTRVARQDRAIGRGGPLAPPSCAGSADIGSRRHQRCPGARAARGLRCQRQLLGKHPASSCCGGGCPRGAAAQSR